jgi:uncharacterized tellurite resistance protein B-like protein
MEFVIIFVVVVVFLLFYIFSKSSPNVDSASGSNGTSDSSNSTNNKSESKKASDEKYIIKRTNSLDYSGSSRVSLSFEIDNIVSPNKVFNGIAVHFGGAINGLANTEVKFRLDLYDKDLENHECKGFILTDLDSLNAGGSGVFRYESNSSNIPYYSASLNNRRLVFIPFDLVDFPKSGTRRIKCEFTILDAGLKGIQYGSTTTSFDLLIPKDGYLDKLEKRDRAYKTLIILALLVAKSDGRIAMKEMSTIEKWIKEKFENKQQQRDLLITYARDVKESIKEENDIYDIKSEIKKFSSDASKKIIYEGLDLLVRIMSADLSHDSNEKAIIQDFIDQNNIPKDEYQKVFNKHIDASMVENEITEVELGITPNMTLDEKKKVLRQQYQLWSKKVTSSDEKVRRNAESMIEKIAQERAKLE